MDAITVCAANYLPLASILGESFLAFNPGSSFSIVVIDGDKNVFEKNPKFTYLTPSNLDISKEVFKNMAFYYNVTELATALKPTALKSLFLSGSKKVVYLDPDIEVFAKFSELEEILNHNPIVLTPHTLKPVPRDDLRPSENEIMSSGAFNLGFIGLNRSEDSENFLNWWEERLIFDSIIDPAENLFTDQRWMDLVPSYFPIYILNEPGYNVAYWNLHERKLSKNSSNIYVNNSPLKFFHFSGYNPEKPWILSKYVSNNPRVVISADPVLEMLCANYGQKLFRAGWTVETSLKYGYENFETGKFIPTGIRRLYREDCIAAYKKGLTFVSPENWQEWATRRSMDSGNLSRILYTVWKSRPDLQRRFPDALSSEAKEFISWARKHGVNEKVIDSEFLEVGALVNDLQLSEINRKKGINIAGYLNAELGVGQSARLIYSAAKETGLPVSIFNSNRVLSRKQENVEFKPDKNIYPLTIAVINADQFELWASDFGKENLSKTYVIGVWAWETEDFPKHLQSALDLVDEIWAVSSFVKEAISKQTKKPIYIFPTPILEHSSIEKLDRNAIKLPENRSFNLFIFDYMSVFNRKNPLGLVEAHIKAFPNQDGPALVIKSTNGNKDAENRERLRFAIRDRIDIFLVENYLSRQQLTALLNECSAYVSLHRSEGYGLTMAEAMSLGKPVVATNYSGNLDFMNDENSLLVPSTLSLIGEGALPYSPESSWAEPNLDRAADYMRMLFLDSSFASKLGKLGQESVLKKFTIGNAEIFLKSRVSYSFSLKGRLVKKISLLRRFAHKIIRATKRYLRDLSSK